MLEEYWSEIMVIGERYGVDPRIFAAIYVGAIPFFLAGSGWLVRNWRNGRSVVLPGILTAVSFVAAYLYVAVFGRGLPWWVWALLAGIVVLGGWSAMRGLRKKVSD